MSRSSFSQSAQNSQTERPPIVTPAKTYGNKHVDAELEALKQRGLAKMLNKHFTETALQLESEKAAADAALKDLEQRKQNTSEFVSANYNGVSPLDEMYMQANRWRAECRRKERETMLLYQRYVHRFGDTLHSIVPHATPDSPLTSAPPPRKAPMTTTTTPGGTQVPNMAAQIEATLEEYLKQGAVSMPSLQTLGKEETYQTAHQKEEEQFRNFYRRQLEGKGVDVKYAGFSITSRPDFPGFPINTIEEKHTTGDDNDDDSVVSGLTTLHSIIIQDCERSVVTYLQEEHEKIQTLVKDDDDESAISQAESMVQQMEEILAEYQTTRSSASKTHREPREYPTDNPNESWMIYYDEFYQQDYYHEKHTNRTQWDPPNSNIDSTSCSTSATLTVSEVMPDIRVYRQRRRAKRRSRVSGLSLLSVIMVALAIVVYRYRNANDSSVLQEWLPKELLPYLPSSVMTTRDSSVQQKTVPKALAVPTPAKVVPVKQQQQEELKAVEIKSISAVVSQSIPTRKQILEPVDNKKKKEPLRRPWLCNIPFACWLHPRCWFLAKHKPLFDPDEFVLHMV